MNRRSVFMLAKVAALGLVLLPSNLNSQQSTLKEQLVGTWTIVSWEDIAPTVRSGRSQIQEASLSSILAGDTRK